MDRGPIADLGAMKERMDELATPNFPREKFVESGLPPHLVPEAALQYEATERVIELAKPPAFRLAKESSIELGAVRKGALLYKTSPRMVELAVPKARANVNDADLKEDPFSINPNALKYKATARIIELAKPVER